MEKYLYSFKDRFSTVERITAETFDEALSKFTGEWAVVYEFKKMAVIESKHQKGSVFGVTWEKIK